MMVDEAVKDREVCIDLIKKTLIEIRERYKNSESTSIPMQDWQLLHMGKIGRNLFEKTIRDQLFKQCLVTAKCIGVKMGLHMKSQLRTICNDYKTVMDINKSLKR